MEQIAVIVPVYKVEAYLERCVDSICTQTYIDLKLILVDDGSPDRCPQMCDDYAKKDGRIHVIHQLNRGLSAARNAGIEWVIKNTDCNWITFVDSDDSIAPCFLSVMLEGALKCGVRVACCGFSRPRENVQFKPPADECSKAVFHVVSPDRFYRSCFNWKFQGTFVSNIACAKLYARDCFAEIRYPVGVRAHEDVYTTYKVLFVEQKIAYTYNRLYRYQLNSKSIMGVRWNPVRMHQFYGDREKLMYFCENGYKMALTAEAAWHFGRIFSTLDLIGERNEFFEQVVELRKILREDFLRYGRQSKNLLALCPRVYREMSPRPWWMYKMARACFKFSRLFDEILRFCGQKKSCGVSFEMIGRENIL